VGLISHHNLYLLANLNLLCKVRCIVNTGWEIPPILHLREACSLGRLVAVGLFQPVKILTFEHKYNDGVPEGSRFATVEMFKNRESSAEGIANIAKVKDLTKIAQSACALRSTQADLTIY
jgi:hypothetical protein